MFAINDLLSGLAESRRVFHSEADFQHALAWHIHQAMPESPIRLEFDLMQIGHQRRYLDIWLPKERIAIELKYKTRELKCKQDEESFFLRDQRAHNYGRYDFLWDIHRLELMCSQMEKCKAGYAVLLTNDPPYWKGPTDRDTMDANFRVHEGREISGPLCWAKPRTQEDRKSPIQIRGSYRLRWRDYSNCPGKSYGRFRYLAVPVE